VINTLLFDNPGYTVPQNLPTTPPQDFGAFASTTLTANTLYLLSSATVSISGAAPDGVYSVGNTTDTVFTDSTFTMSDFAPDSNFLINVTSVPEPSAWGLLLGGGLGCLILLRIRRQKAGASARLSEVSAA
jgi:hypothetical protein